ncbi:MAG: response regulator [Campylobacterota bacterium]|nr:response regulator [Campylobacterota bacterium]
MNILLLDSSYFNNAVIRQDTQKYFDNNGIKYNYFETSDTVEAIDILNNNDIDIAYIDISSNKFDGIDLLKKINSLKKEDLKVVAVTTLYDKKYRYEALKLAIYNYIYKPYDYKEIELCLDKYFKNNPNKIENTDDDLFMDFDEEEESQDDDFFDFDDEEITGEVEHDKELMSKFNETHKKVSAEEFLESYKDEYIDTEELEELEEMLDNLVAKILFEDNLEDKVPDIVFLLEKYHRFLYTFSEFEELSTVLEALIELLNNTDFSCLKRQKIISKFIVAIIQDLVEWKEHLFILQDTVDIYYINASILNSYIQLKDII